jgi:hypothetical protein
MSKLQDKNTREYRLYHNITTPEQEMQGLEAIIRNLKRERDEARQLYCGAVEKIQHGITNETKRSVADFLGWDCFKENTNG